MYAYVSPTAKLLADFFGIPEYPDHAVTLNNNDDFILRCDSVSMH